jgi:hypothetical protein
VKKMIVPLFVLGAVALGLVAMLLIGIFEF